MRGTGGKREEREGEGGGERERGGKGRGKGREEIIIPAGSGAKGVR